MGLDKQDSLLGHRFPQRYISVDGFWMDETEVTTPKYKQFVMWVRTVSYVHDCRSSLCRRRELYDF